MRVLSLVRCEVEICDSNRGSTMRVTEMLCMIGLVNSQVQWLWGMLVATEMLVCGDSARAEKLPK